MALIFDFQECPIKKCIRSTPTIESWRQRLYCKGLTLMEMVTALAIVATLATIAVPNYIGYREKTKISKAISDIKMLETEISIYETNNNILPKQLSDLGKDSLKDPWGNPYCYLPVAGTKVGKLRKDHSMVPVNSDYDLYSKGKDGESATAFTADSSNDDIVRARDGAYVGLVANY